MIRCFFDTPAAAALALKTVLQRARTTKDEFEFGPLDLTQLTESGMWITGDTDILAAALKKIPGCVLEDPLGR